MEITRILTNSQKGSQFEDIYIPMDKKSHFGFFSASESKLKQMFFQNIMPHQEWDYLSPHSSIYVIVLSGILQIQTSDGSKKEFRTGDVILMDDHGGVGHKVNSLQETVSVIVIQLE